MLQIIKISHFYVTWACSRMIQIYLSNQAFLKTDVQVNIWVDELSSLNPDAKEANLSHRLDHHIISVDWRCNPPKNQSQPVCKCLRSLSQERSSLRDHSPTNSYPSAPGTTQNCLFAAESQHVCRSSLHSR